MGKRWDANKERSLKRFLTIYPRQEAIRRFSTCHKITVKAVSAKADRLSVKKNDAFITLKDFYLALGVCQKTGWKVLELLALKELKVGNKRYIKRQDIVDKLRDRDIATKFIKSFPWFNIVGLYQIIKNYGLCKRIENIRDNLQSAGCLHHRAVEFEIIYQGDLYTVQELASKLYCHTQKVYEQIHRGELQIYRERLTIPKYDDN